MAWIKWTLQYAFNAHTLWWSGSISFQTLRRALREHPIAVCGQGGSYQVDPDDLI
jgi:hypothetical protein